MAKKRKREKRGDYSLCPSGRRLLRHHEIVFCQKKI
jgi:hypothetical protein